MSATGFSPTVSASAQDGSVVVGGIIQPRNRDGIQYASEKLSDFALDDLPEIVEDDDSPYACERHLRFGPEQHEQIERMREKPAPPWLAEMVERRSR